jgi:hypothetical protein
VGVCEHATDRSQDRRQLSHLVLRSKPDAHRMCAHDQVFTHTTRITSI